MQALGPEALKEKVSPAVRTLITCATCSHNFSFEEGEHLAGHRGIQEKVVLCPRCESIFEVDMTPEGVTIVANVTARYGARAPSPIGQPGDTSNRRELNTLKFMILEFLALGFAVGAMQVGGGIPMVVIGCIAVLMALFGIYVWRRM